MRISGSLAPGSGCLQQISGFLNFLSANSFTAFARAAGGVAATVATAVTAVVGSGFGVVIDPGE